MILINILLGSVLTVITILIHGGATTFIINLVHKHADPKHKHYKYLKNFYISFVVLLMFIITIIETIIWALSYLILNAIHGFEQALYFSVVTFTTLGYGDITLSGKWRLLASFEAAIGVIIFGWTTAIVLSIVQKIYFKKQ